MPFEWNRRAFLAAAAGGISSPVRAIAENGPRNRADICCDIRTSAARAHAGESAQDHPVNGDERWFPNGAASFSKGLMHDVRGEPLGASYPRLVNALRSGSFGDLENMVLGGEMKLSNPLAQNAFELEGPDSHQLGMPAPPAFSSAEQSGEMVELYWQALTRDIPFSRWPHDDAVSAAVADLNACPDFRGPRSNGRVTAQTLFRIDAPGVCEGPHVSQFLLRPVPWGSFPMEQRYRTPAPGRDFVFLFKDWLAVQNGVMTMDEMVYDPVPRYAFTPRALTGYVHSDYSFQAFLCAALTLSRMGSKALSDANPYKNSRVQAGFATFGEPHIIDCISRAANASLKAAWFQKWLVHRRIRPEEFAFRVHGTLLGNAGYPISGDLAKSAALERVRRSTGGLMLAQAWPEGCPLHPSYPAGHAVIAGACCTMLKAFFDEKFEMPEPVAASDSGAALTPYRDGPLEVGGELNKLAANIAMARDTAGVHWRSDSYEGLRQGEAVALGLLRDIATTPTEPFQGFRLTTFDGRRVTVNGPRGGG